MGPRGDKKFEKPKMSDPLSPSIRGDPRDAKSLSLSHSYIHDLIAFNNKTVRRLCQRDIYLSELNVEKANRMGDQANYLDLIFMTGNNNILRTNLYDKHDNFNFQIVSFPFMSRNVPSGPSHGVYTWQLIRYQDNIKSTKIEQLE